MKFAISFFGVLVIIISGMLFFQYQVYSDKLETTQGDFYYTQEIEITYRSNSLDVRQHFKNLPNQTIDIKWPEYATNPDCFIESENSCKRLSEDKLTFKKGENMSQSVSYIIPLEGGLTSNQLLKEAFVTLSNGEASYSTVHISTDQDVGGQWITGLPLIGQQSLSLVNYAMFSGAGPVTEVFWRKGNMNVQKISDLLSIYSSKPLSKDFTENIKKLNVLNDEHIAIVEGTNSQGEQGMRTLFLSDLSMESLKKNVILSQVLSQYKFNDSPQWISEVVASFLTGANFGGEKASEIVETLTSQMTDSQLTDWLNKLKKLEGKDISAKVLDEALSEVLGSHTNYLSMNETIKGNFPFVLNEHRELYINSELKEDVNIIFKDGLTLYSAQEILKNLGYEASVGENGYYVKNDSRSFRFPEGHDFYVFNQRRFNTVSDPIVIIAGSYFIEETWLQRLFLIEIEKNSDRISINATAVEQQE